MKKRLLNLILIYIFITILFFSSIIVLKLIDYKCIYKEWFDIYCAGCGTTRMFLAILKLDFYTAFRYNPLMFIMLIILIMYIIYISFLYLVRNKKPIIKAKILIILGIILIIYMILRNIPFFSFLAPIE